MTYKMKGFSGFGNSPAKQKKNKNGDEFGKIKKGEYPSIIQDVNPVEKDEKGLYTTSSGGWIGDLTPEEATSDTTRYPKGFSTWQGELKEGDYIDETAHEAWQGVDVEKEEGVATGKRKVYNKKTKKYEDYKGKKK